MIKVLKSAPVITITVAIIAASLVSVSSSAASSAASATVVKPKPITKTVKGLHGEILTATPTTVAAGSAIKVQGTHFDETVGIYLAFCVIPAKGTMPTPCGGGINRAAAGDASFWISSNPPPYGIGLAQEFLPGGRFTRTLHISSMIGRTDCRKVRCAITVRADHTRESERSYDLFIPITFSPLKTKK